MFRAEMLSPTQLWLACYLPGSGEEGDRIAFEVTVGEGRKPGLRRGGASDGTRHRGVPSLTRALHRHRALCGRSGCSPVELTRAGDLAQEGFEHGWPCLRTADVACHKGYQVHRRGTQPEVEDGLSVHQYAVDEP